MRKVFEKGFTLAEMLVVLFIIGVILGIGIPIVSNIMNDSSTEEFVTNAKLVEDSVNMYYRDYGVMPISEAGNVSSKIDEKSKEIIKSKLVEAGVLNAGDVTEKLIDGGHVKFVKFEDVKEYTNLTKDANGIEVFVVVDMVDDLSNFGTYENDIAGFVFSTETRDKSSGLIYSGAHSISKDKLEKDDKGNTVVDKESQEIDKETLGNKNKAMYPYGFRTKTSEDLKNGKANLTVTWTNRFVDKDNELTTLKGFTGDEYVINYVVCDLNTSDIDCLKSLNSGGSDVTTINVKNDNSTGGTYSYEMKDIKYGKIMMKLKANKVLYAGSAIEGKKSKAVLLDGPSNFDAESAGSGGGTDTNGDGKDDVWDRDGDGNPDAWDTNGDGKPDAWDTNGDGKPDTWDTNGDGKPDAWDRDGDGKPDAWDKNPPFDGKPDTWDNNGDGKPDGWDTDGDGRPDAWDKIPPFDGKPDAWDKDGDGSPDSWDRDGDGKPDYSLEDGDDTNGDGLPDTWDINGDGKPDAWDKDALKDKNPVDPNGLDREDYKPSGKPDTWDEDFNNKPDSWDTNDDKLPDAWDTDGDGKPDAWDLTPPFNGFPDAWDTDGDGIPDDFDTDNDGIPDTKDTDGDGKPDGENELGVGPNGENGGGDSDGGGIPGGVVPGRPTNPGGNGNGDGDGNGDGTDGTGDNNPDDGIDVPVKAPGEGLVEVLDSNPKPEDFFKTYESYASGKVTVKSEFEGLRIAGLSKGDFIVLKEVKKVGSSYEFDKNRFVVFKATGSTILIPKNPYLQKDFQVNPSSSYKYVLEFYKNKYLGNTAPNLNSSIFVEYK